MEKEKNNSFRKAGLGLGMSIGAIVIVSMLMMNTISPVVDYKEERMWYTIQCWTVAEGDPGAGASGFLQIFFINNTADMNTSMYENDSNILMDWCDSNMVAHNSSATADNFDLEVQAEQTFAIVVRCRFNKTNCADGSDFWDTNTDCQITMSCTSWDDGNDESNTSDRDVGAVVVSSNNSDHDFIYINFCWNANDDGGYQLSKDATLTISEIYIEGKW